MSPAGKYSGEEDMRVGFWQFTNCELSHAYLYYLHFWVHFLRLAGLLRGVSFWDVYQLCSVRGIPTLGLNYLGIYLSIYFAVSFILWNKKEIYAHISKFDDRKCNKILVLLFKIHEYIAHGRSFHVLRREKHSILYSRFIDICACK